VSVLRSPHDREIWRLALPAFGALIAEPLYVVADTAVVGHLGTPELAGLAVANGILLLLFTIFIFLAYGTTATVARLIGAGDHREAAHQAVQSLWLAVLLGLALVVVGEIVAEPLVRVFGAEGDVADNALVYLRIALLGVPAMLVVFAGTGYLRGLQDTFTPLVVSISTAAGNFALEAVLIWGLGFGIGASALTTVLAQAVAASIYVARIARSVREHEVALAPRFETIRQLLVMGRDLLIRTATLRIALVAATFVATQIGTDALAAYEISFAVFTTLALALDAIAIAAQAMVGRLLGAGDAGEARAASRRMIEWGLAAGLLGALGVLLLRPWLAHLFTSDPAVLEIVTFLLLLVALLQPLSGVVFTLDGILIGAGDMTYLAVAMVISTAVYLPAAAAVLVLDVGVGWLWAALGLLLVARAVTLGVRFAGHRWERTGSEIRTA
jgi:putative MATE family efflux protein